MFESDQWQAPNVAKERHEIRVNGGKPRIVMIKRATCA